MICVSIGRGRHRHMIAEHAHLAEQGIRLVELRLDYIQGPVQVKRLLRERPCPAIVTCRRASDGRRWGQSEEARQRTACGGTARAGMRTGRHVGGLCMGSLTFFQARSVATALTSRLANSS